MASIPKLLMDEFYAMERAALDAEDYDRSTAFSSCESMVNNFMHGREPRITLSFCRKIFLENSLNEDFEAGSREAYAEAVIVVDIFADQYGLKLISEPYSSETL